MANPLTLASAEDLAKGREGNRALLSDILSIPRAAYSNATENVQQIGQFAKDMATDPQARQQFGQQFAAESKKPILPQDVQNAALSFAPGGMTLAGMTAYHGTPHMFEPTAENPLGKFNLEKIGTGEGAQAYGHGIYVAESPDVAKQYQFMLSKVDPKKVNYGGKSAEQHLDEAYKLQDKANRTGNKNLLDEANAKAAYWEGIYMRRHPEDIKRMANDPDDGWPAFAKYANSIDQKKITGIENSGSFYHVDVPDTHVEKMLDWDAPVEGSIASKIVSAAKKTKGMNPQDFEDALGLSKMYEGELAQWRRPAESGSSIYRLISSSLKSDAKASEWLKKHDIPGIKFFDAASRGEAEGTRNLVLFDPEIANITKRE